MKEKLFNLIDRDPLLLHKLGFIVGAVMGVIGGLMVSERADYIVVEEDIENNGETETQS